jgi:hypothetical protein
MKKSLFAVFFLISFQSFGQVKYLKDPSETEKLSAKATDLFIQNKMNDCFKELQKYWPLPENEIEALQEKTTRYMNIIEDRFGKAIDFKKVKNEVIADFSIRETYIIRFENTAIRVIYTYYKNNNGWILNEFKWDDSFAEEFKESEIKK